MNWLWKAFLLGFALAMDCLALGIGDGLVYGNERKRKFVFIAFIFGLFQGIMPLLGFLFGQIFASWIDAYDHWVGFALLGIVGGKMVYDGIKAFIHPERIEEKAFSYKEVLFQGVADSIDALAVGISLGANLGLEAANFASYEIYIAVLIIALMSFLIALIGLFGGRFFYKLLKGREGITNLLGGLIILFLAVMILLEGLHVIAF